jgi:hypothetical protein
MKGSWEAEKCLENRNAVALLGNLKETSRKNVIHIPSS